MHARPLPSRSKQTVKFESAKSRIRQSQSYTIIVMSPTLRCPTMPQYRPQQSTSVPGLFYSQTLFRSLVALSAKIRGPRKSRSLLLSLPIRDTGLNPILSPFFCLTIIQYTADMIVRPAVIYISRFVATIATRRPLINLDSLDLIAPILLSVETA